MTSASGTICRIRRLSTRPGPHLNERPCTQFPKRLHRAAPLDGGGHLTNQALPSLITSGDGPPRHVVDQRTGQVFKLRLLKQRLQALPGRIHEGAMKRSAHGQSKRPASAPRPRQPAGAIHGVNVPRNDNLLRRIEVRGGDHLALRGFPADFLQRADIQTQDRSHAAHSHRDRLLHESAALAHQANGICELQGPGRNQSGILSQTVTRDKIGPASPLAQRPQESDRRGQNRRLGIGGQRQVPAAAPVADLAQAESQFGVGPIEDLSGCRIGLSYVQAHSRGLGPLTWKDKCDHETSRRKGGWQDGSWTRPRPARSRAPVKRPANCGRYAVLQLRAAMPPPPG